MLTHDRAAIISIGDELILGQTLDTNSQWLSTQLGEWNIRVVEHVTVPDDLEAHAAAIERLARAVPLVICTGGLGPTADDLTREALARVMGEQLITDADSLARIEALFAKRARPMTDLQRTQALRPRSAVSLRNDHGTAPGLFGRVQIGRDPCEVFCLPGPPNEMRPMLLEVVRPMLRPPVGRVVGVRVLHTLGMGEGDLAARLGPLMDRARNPLVGTTASGGIVSIRIRCEGLDAAATAAALDETEQLCRHAASPFVFGAGDETLMSATIDLLRGRGEKLVTVESCTGGMVGSLLTSVPGSSDVYLGGWVTYANEMKAAEVGVPEAMIAEHGAVSEQVACAMAEGALRSQPAAHHAIAITGIAGPGGGSALKPVGTVFIAVASCHGLASSTSRAPTSDERMKSTEIRRFIFSGGREAVRDRAAKMALAMVRFRAAGVEPGRLLWEVSG